MSATTSQPAIPSPSSDVVNVAAQLKTDATLYNTFYLVGLIALGVVFLTAWLSPRIQRASVWFLFIFSWIFTSIASILLLGEQTGSLPNPTICLSQAILLYSAPVFSAYCGLSYILHLYFSVLAALRGKVWLLRSSIIVILHLVPCLVLIGMAILIVVITSMNPSILQRDPSGLYCHVTNTMPAKVEGTLIMGAMAILIVVEVLIVLIFIKTRRNWKQVNRVSKVESPADNMFLDAVVRAVIFTFLPLISLVMSIFDFLPNHSDPVQQYAISDIFVSTIPIAAALIFGTQRDMLKTWACGMRQIDEPSRTPSPSLKGSAESV